MRAFAEKKKKRKSRKKAFWLDSEDEHRRSRLPNLATKCFIVGIRLADNNPTGHEE